MRKKIIGTICVLTLVIGTVLPVFGMENVKIPTIFSGDNNPPNPPIINGPISGTTKDRLCYEVIITDPDIDDLMFFLEINFGGETISYHPGYEAACWRNGSVVLVSYRWKTSGSHFITARVQDCSGAWSKRSEPLPVSISKSMISNKIFLRFLENHPYMFPLLRQLFNL